MTFGEDVFVRRRALGLSQTDLATALGVSVGTINKIEHGTISSNSKTAKRVSELLHLDTWVDSIYSTGDKNLDLAMLEKRINNAIFELELILSVVRSLKGETDESSV